MPHKDPQIRREYDRNRKRALRAAASQADPSMRPPGVAPVPLQFRLHTAQNAIAALEEQARLVSVDPKATATERARCIGYLISIALRAIEAGDLAARVEALEALLRREREAAA